MAFVAHQQFPAKNAPDCVGCCRHKIQGSPFACLLHTFDLVVKPGAEVLIVHPGVIETFDREETVGQIDKEKDCKAEDDLEAEALVSYKVGDNIGHG